MGWEPPSASYRDWKKIKMIETHENSIQKHEKDSKPVGEGKISTKEVIGPFKRIDKYILEVCITIVIK